MYAQRFAQVLFGFGRLAYAICDLLVPPTFFHQHPTPLEIGTTFPLFSPQWRNQHHFRQPRMGKSACLQISHALDSRFTNGCPFCKRKRFRFQLIRQYVGSLCVWWDGLIPCHAFTRSPCMATKPRYGR